MKTLSTNAVMKMEIDFLTETLVKVRTEHKFYAFILSKCPLLGKELKKEI
jgi:hypothetical protein